MSDLPKLFDRLWSDYLELNPDARRITALLGARGEAIVNDHIALRTFNDPRVNIDVLAQAFLDGGYREADTYEFEAKQLDARHYEHDNPEFPRVFISELRLGSFSASLQQTIAGLLDQMPVNFTDRWDLAAAGRPWFVSYAAYEALRAESEYAAWMAAFGFRPNHFTISINDLRTFDSIRDFTGYISEQGFALNTSGGEIKGTPDEFLEQASTLANEVDVEFSDGTYRIPSCYYEFAQRYPLPDGSLFQGFIAKSADKIFESTDKR